MEVNETNIVKIYLYICIKFLMYKILFWQLKLVSAISIFAIKITSFVYKTFKLLYFPLPLFFPVMVIADFIEEVD